MVEGVVWLWRRVEAGTQGKGRRRSSSKAVLGQLVALPLSLPAQVFRVLFYPRCLYRLLFLRYNLRSFPFGPWVSDLSYRSSGNISQTPTVAYSPYSKSALLADFEADDHLSLFRTLTPPTTSSTTTICQVPFPRTLTSQTQPCLPPGHPHAHRSLLIDLQSSPTLSEYPHQSLSYTLTLLHPPIMLPHPSRPHPPFLPPLTSDAPQLPRQHLPHTPLPQPLIILSSSSTSFRRHTCLMNLITPTRMSFSHHRPRLPATIPFSVAVS